MPCPRDSRATRSRPSPRWRTSSSTPPRLDLFARQLGDILAYADEVQQIDTTGVPPTASVVARHAADRPDEVRPSLDRDEALANAPDAALDAGFFRVPRVIG